MSGQCGRAVAKSTSAVGDNRSDGGLTLAGVSARQQIVTIMWVLFGIAAVAAAERRAQTGGPSRSDQCGALPSILVRIAGTWGVLVMRKKSWKLIGLVATAGIALAGCLAPGTHVVTPTLKNNTAVAGLWHTFGGNGCYWARLNGNGTVLGS